MRQILPNQEAEDGRRSAERCDMIILYHLQDVGRMELFMVVYENRSSGNPLAVQFSPHGLSPSRVGYGQMQAVFVQVMPITSGRDMSERIGEIMSHHLRFTGSSRSEIHQGYVVVPVGMFRFDKRRGS